MPNTPHMYSSKLQLPSARNPSLKRHVTVSLTVAEPGIQPLDNPEAPEDSCPTAPGPVGRSSGRCPLGGGAAGAEDQGRLEQGRDREAREQEAGLGRAEGGLPRGRGPRSRPVQLALGTRAQR